MQGLAREDRTYFLARHYVLEPLPRFPSTPAAHVRDYMQCDALKTPANLKCHFKISPSISTSNASGPSNRSSRKDATTWETILWTTPVGISPWRGTVPIVVAAVVSTMFHAFCVLYAQEHSKNGHVEAAEARRLPSRRAWEYGVGRDITPSSVFGRLHSTSTATAYGSSWLHIFYL